MKLRVSAEISLMLFNVCSQEVAKEKQQERRRIGKGSNNPFAISNSLLHHHLLSPPMLHWLQQPPIILNCNRQEQLKTANCFWRGHCHLQIRQTTVYLTAKTTITTPLLVMPFQLKKHCRGTKYIKHSGFPGNWLNVLLYWVEYFYFGYFLHFIAKNGKEVNLNGVGNTESRLTSLLILSRCCNHKNSWLFVCVTWTCFLKLSSLPFFFPVLYGMIKMTV